MLSQTVVEGAQYTFRTDNHRTLAESIQPGVCILKRCPPFKICRVLMFLFVIMCYVIKMYRALSYFELRVDHQQNEVRRRNDQMRINLRNPRNHNRYPTEHDERRG